VTLVIDNRADLNFAGPGVHALIVGVSDYLNLPDADEPPAEPFWFMSKLSSPALSAFKVFQAIQQKDALRLPLKTVRLLLSPSQAEITAEPALANSGAARANRTAFETAVADWRGDATRNASDITFLFYSGHGIQRGPEEGILLLDDFLSRPGAALAKCIEIGNIRNGMAPSPAFPNIALTQFYFIDACLARPEVLAKFVNPQVPDVFDVELNVVDRREAPMMFSTVDGAIALARKGKVSHFAEALMLALQRAAEEPEEVDGLGTVWPVTSLTVMNALNRYYAANKLGTKPKMGSIVGSPILRYLPGPPDVDLAVEVRPENLGAPCGIGVLDENNVAIPNCNPAAMTKFGLTVKAGIYRVQVDSGKLQASPYRSPLKLITQKAPQPWLHNLTPLLRP
jgi:Caspase domain